MAAKTEIVDNFFGHRTGAAVTKRGQIVTSPLEYNEIKYNSLVMINTAYNYVKPISGKRFVIDGIAISGAKDVNSSNGAKINIYEAGSDDSVSIINNLFSISIGRLERGSLVGINVITNSGVWINAFTDDSTVDLTILGYYVIE